MHLAVQAVPVRDDRAGVIGVMAVCRDVTPRHEVDAALRSSRGRPTGAPAPRALGGFKPRGAGTVPGMADVAMPRLSDSMEEGTILKWLKSDGDEVKRGEELVEIETDKANMTYEADSDGTLTIVAKEGDTLPVGETIARLGDGSESGGEDEDARGGARSRGAAGGARGRGRARGRGGARGGGAAPATASARRRPSRRPRRPRRRPATAAATAHQGVAGRQADGARDGRRARPARGLRARAAGSSRPTSRPPPRAAPRPPRRRRPPKEEQEPAEEAPRRGARRRRRRTSPLPSSPATSRPAAARPPQQDLTRLQQTVARRMAESKATAPDFVLTVEVDMEEAVALRKQLKAAAGDQPAPSFNDFVIKASALALRDFPRANGAYRDGKFELYGARQRRRGRRGPGRARRCRPCSTPTPSRSATSPASRARSPSACAPARSPRPSSRAARSPSPTSACTASSASSP